MFMEFSIVGSLALALWRPFWRCRWPLVLLIKKPILFGIIQRINHFGNEFVLFCDLKHCSGILVPATVVCR